MPQQLRSYLEQHASRLSPHYEINIGNNKGLDDEFIQGLAKLLVDFKYKITGLVIDGISGANLGVLTNALKKSMALRKLSVNCVQAYEENYKDLANFIELGNELESFILGGDNGRHTINVFYALRNFHYKLKEIIVQGRWGLEFGADTCIGGVALVLDSERIQLKVLNLQALDYRPLYINTEGSRKRLDYDHIYINQKAPKKLEELLVALTKQQCLEQLYLPKNLQLAENNVGLLTNILKKNPKLKTLVLDVSSNDPAVIRPIITSIGELNWLEDLTLSQVEGYAGYTTELMTELTKKRKGRISYFYLPLKSLSISGIELSEMTNLVSDLTKLKVLEKLELFKKCVFNPPFEDESALAFATALQASRPPKLKYLSFKYCRINSTAQARIRTLLLGIEVVFDDQQTTYAASSPVTPPAPPQLIAPIAVPRSQNISSRDLQQQRANATRALQQDKATLQEELVANPPASVDDYLKKNFLYSCMQLFDSLFNKRIELDTELQQIPEHPIRLEELTKDQARQKLGSVSV